MAEENTSPKISSVETVSFAPTNSLPDKLKTEEKPLAKKLTNIQTALIPPNITFEPHKFETGWERVMAMYKKDECGLRGPEIMFVSQTAFFSGVSGAILGGYFGGKQSHYDFVKKNEVTLFHGQNDGRRRLNDHVMLGTLRKAFYYGWRFSAFTSCYLLTMFTISTYRNKSSLLEFITAGGVTGAIFKFNLGLKGMISGGVIGAAMGIFPGMFTLSFMWITGTKPEDLRYWREQRKSKYKSEVQDRFQKIRMKSAISEDYQYDTITLAHDQRLKHEKLEN